MPKFDVTIIPGVSLITVKGIDGVNETHATEKARYTYGGPSSFVVNWGSDEFMRVACPVREVELNEVLPVGTELCSFKVTVEPSTEQQPSESEKGEQTQAKEETMTFISSQWLYCADKIPTGFAKVRIDRVDGIAGVKYAVRQAGACMDSAGKWELEPSDRTNAWLSRFRYESWEEAAAAIGRHCTPLGRFHDAYGCLLVED